ncbi:MAG: Jag N-terminal domain-containing protein [Armatimonadetes bacterium]|nr:Jag N-terminal domain-containing protein [Armatimonadota bacterium]
MTWIETSGRSLEEAKEAAARELGVAVDQIEVEVLDEGSKGFLGLGPSKVRVRATVLGTGNGGGAQDQQETPTLDDSAAQTTEEIGTSKGQQALAILEDVLRTMDFDVRPALTAETDEEIQIEFSGASDDIGRLIGRHGQTLDALQYLLAVALNRAYSDRVRVLLDAEGYRERHRQMIEAKAREYARRVKDTGSEAVIEPQNARDRRLMHLALADDPDVYTYSEGEGDERHVVISPKK